jgi:hypothetical protein
VTIGPDLDWLADDEGNLRPQVARELANAPPPEPMRPEAEPLPEPRRVVGQVVRRLAAAPVPRVAWTAERPRVSLTLLVLGVGLAGVIGFAVGKWRSSAVHPMGEVVGPTPTAAPLALVNGHNVNLRSGPGLAFPALARLLTGEALQVRDEQAGWYSVTTSTGLGGWVFGAFVRGRAAPDRGPALVTKLLASDGSGPRVILRPDDKVFVARQPDGSTVIVLPTGRDLRVSPNVLAPIE